MLSTIPTSSRGARRGFTLIEVMLVISIIAVLAVVAGVAGLQVKRSQARKFTIMEMNVLKECLKDYESRYGGNPDLLKPPTSGLAVTTANPLTDPYNWVAAFMAVPDLKAKLTGSKMRVDTEKDASNNDHMVILDGYGTPIRFATEANVISTLTAPSPSPPAKPQPDPSMPRQAFFVSAGPDGVFHNVTPQPTPEPKMDDVHSYDSF